jgi:hypothetical protein
VKNKIFVLGSLILALGLVFSACDSAATFDKVKGVNKGDITVTRAFTEVETSGTTTRSVITYYVKFTASADLAEYAILFKEDGKKSSIYIAYPTNEEVPRTVTQTYGSTTYYSTTYDPNTDTDMWYAVFDTDAIPKNLTGKIGVAVTSYRNDQNPNVTWTDETVRGTGEGYSSYY